MSVASKVAQQGFQSIFYLGALVGIAGFVLALCIIFANPNAQLQTFAAGEDISFNSSVCNNRVIILGPGGVDAHARLPVCGPNATIEFYPATGWEAPSPGFNSVIFKNSQGNAVNTNAGQPVTMTQIRKVSCSEISGAWNCVMQESV